MVTLSEFPQQFTRLRDEYRAVNEQVEKRLRVTAPRYNSFRLFGLTEKKHSAFLADLLNPEGSHDQGDLFLRHFIRNCRDRCDKTSLAGLVSEGTPWSETTSSGTTVVG